MRRTGFLVVWAVVGIALCIVGSALGAGPPPDAAALIALVASDDAAHGGVARLLSQGTGEIRDSVQLSFSWIAYLRSDGELVFLSDMRFPSSVTLGLTGVRDDAGNAPVVSVRGSETIITFNPEHAMRFCDDHGAEKGRCVAETILRRPLREFEFVTGFSVRVTSRIDEPLS